MSSGAEDVQHQVGDSSVLLLLLQEATKLAPPAGHQSPAQHQDRRSLVPCGPELTGPVSVQRGSSAWEVMRLINQQCERLLRSGHEDGDQEHMDGTEAAPPLYKPPGVCLRSGPSWYSGGVAYVSDPSNSLTDVEEVHETTELMKTSSSDELGSEKCLTEHVSEPHEACESVPPSTGIQCARPLDTSDSAAPADLNNNLLEVCDGRRHSRRKQPRPVRSPDPRDAHVPGVTFSMYPELNAADHSRLIITSSYSEEVRRWRRSRSSRCRSLHVSQRSSSSDDESFCLSRSKICASCRTRKTPLWRDAEDGTPLCNACGIRYKKYRVRCQQCWNIPRKEASSTSTCLKCGDELKLKSSGW